MADVHLYCMILKKGATKYCDKPARVGWLACGGCYGTLTEEGKTTFAWFVERNKQM